MFRKKKKQGKLEQVDVLSLFWYACLVTWNKFVHKKF